MKVIALIRRRPVGTYLGLAFTISWVGCLLAAGLEFILGRSVQAVDVLLVFLSMLLGPALAGIAMTGIVDGRSGLRDLFSRMRKCRFGARWYSALLVFPVLIMLVILALRAVVSRDFALTFAPLGIAIGLAAGFFEEIGWTGYALPKMLGKHSALAVAIWLGFLHAIWHLMADFLAASAVRGVYWLPHFAAFAVSMTAVRVLIVWVYANTKSVLLAQLMHASSTGFLAILVPLTLSPAKDSLFYGAYAVVLWVAVAIIAALFGTNLVRTQAGISRS
jgi:membrane protease YdiL (CAAX protease family)